MLVSPNVESSLRMRPILAAGELSASIRRAIRGGLSIMGPDRKRSGGESPGERLAATQRLQLGVAEGQRLRQGPGELLQRHRRLVRRHAIEGRAGAARELLEAVERAGRLEGFRVQLEGAESGVAAGAAARVLLESGGMRCAVGAEEEAPASRRRRGDEGAPVFLALQH